MSVKVLFVDDDENLRKAMTRYMGRQLPLETAANAQEALEILKSGDEFGVIVSDLRMPGMDGIEFLALVQKQMPDTVRIMLTGFADIHSVLDAVNKGWVFRFLTKPCAPELLHQGIQEGLAQYRRVQAERELHAMTKFKSTLENVVMAFIRIVESRDPYTAGHQRRVAELARAIARQMKLDTEQVQAIHLAALLHDLGKISVPSAFLNKPGKLTKAEFEVIKAHPVVAHDILGNLDFEWPLSCIILQHHERMDGSGYPEGIKNGDILLEARILMVADVVEAISSHRPYRPSLGIDTGLDEIEKNRGQLYDEAPVDACLALFREQNWDFSDSGPLSLS